MKNGNLLLTVTSITGIDPAIQLLHFHELPQHSCHHMEKHITLPMAMSLINNVNYLPANKTVHVSKTFMHKRQGQTL